MSTPDTPTPRTDEAECENFPSTEPIVAAKRMRQLERELTAAKEESLEQARLLGMSGEREADLRGEIEWLRRRVEAADGLVAAMEGIGNYTGEGGPGTPWREIVRDLGARAREALVEFRATEGKK